MSGSNVGRIIRLFIVAALLTFGLGSSQAQAGGKLGAYGLRMVPDGDDAEDFGRAGWGAGAHVVVPVPKLGNLLAGVLGFEYVNLLSETIVFSDFLTGLRIEQQTEQHYFRFYLGSQVGGHGHGFVRPHAGLNLALIHYGISTDVVVPDDINRENEIRQNLESENHLVFGYDLTLGVDLNFNDKFAIDGGVRYLKSFSVPQALGDRSVTVHPQYFQVYLGVGLSFAAFDSMSE